MEAKIREAIEKIGKDPQLQAQFKSNPKQTLASLGLDPNQIKLVKAGSAVELSDEEIQNIAGGISICANHGFGSSFETSMGF